MIRAGIVGGAGYTGGELLRLLLLHPGVEIVFVSSRSKAGKAVYTVHRDLTGETELLFSKEPVFDADVLFLCMGHGESQRFFQNNDVPDSIKIIDLSRDFRFTAHPSRSFVYGLPEAYRKQIKSADSIANPGCFATSIELALLPLARRSMLTQPVHVSGITGSTGAGQQPTATTHFSWRDSNISLYKPFRHQHLDEVRQTLKAAQKSALPDIRFLPFRGNFTRGILSAVYTSVEGDLQEIKQEYINYYAAHPFVTVVDENPDVKQAVNTNKAFLYLDKQDDQLLIVSVIDNLLKGASGQAVQNMNLMFGLEETAGLGLKGSGF